MQYRGGGVGHVATWQCNEMLLTDEHTELADKYVVLTVKPEPINNQDDESKGKDSDKVGNNSEHNNSVDLDNLNDTDLVDVAGFAPL